MVSHEIGQWCVYPNFDEIAKYTGVVKAKNFEVFRDSLQANHLGDQARDFLMASGKLQTLCYKEEIESALRTPGLGGFQLLDLHDFPGQGSALVGVLDPFWDSKPLRHAGRVPSVRLPDRAAGAAGEAHLDDRRGLHRRSRDRPFRPAGLGARPRIVWSLEEKGTGTDHDDRCQSPFRSLTGAAKDRLRRLAAGSHPRAAVRPGPRACRCERVAAPAKRVLKVAVEGTDYANDWDVWVYPPSVETAPPQDVLVASSLDDAAAKHLEAGGKVLLLPAAGTVKGDRYGKIPPGFSSIFWNTAWTAPPAPHTLGILCDPKHPALAAFPPSTTATGSGGTWSPSRRP